MDTAHRVEHEVRRATLHYLHDLEGGSDEDLHPDDLDAAGRDLELALELLEEWKKREAGAKRR